MSGVVWHALVFLGRTVALALGVAVARMVARRLAKHFPTSVARVTIVVFLAFGIVAFVVHVYWLAVLMLVGAALKVEPIRERLPRGLTRPGKVPNFAEYQRILDRRRDRNPVPSDA